MFDSSSSLQDTDFARNVEISFIPDNQRPSLVKTIDVIYTPNPLNLMYLYFT